MGDGTGKVGKADGRGERTAGGKAEGRKWGRTEANRKSLGQVISLQGEGGAHFNYQARDIGERKGGGYGRGAAKYSSSVGRLLRLCGRKKPVCPRASLEGAVRTREGRGKEKRGFRWLVEFQQIVQSRPGALPEISPQFVDVYSVSQGNTRRRERGVLIKLANSGIKIPRQGRNPTSGLLRFRGFPAYSGTREAAIRRLKKGVLRWPKSRETDRPN